MDVEDVVNKALQKAEKLEPEEFKDLKEDISKYEALKTLAREVAEEDKRIIAVLKNKIESGDEESIELELSKICSPGKLKIIKESLEVETFHMYIAKIEGVDTVTTMGNGQEVFPAIQLKSVADVTNAQYKLWGSILIECAILISGCAGVRMNIHKARMNIACNTVSEWFYKPVMRRTFEIFESSWKANTKALARAKAIFDIVRKIYINRKFWELFYLMCLDMWPADWAQTAAPLAALVIPAFTSDGNALMAKIVVALSSAYNLSKKINNSSHLAYIKKQLESQQTDVAVT